MLIAAFKDIWLKLYSILPGEEGLWREGRPGILALVAAPVTLPPESSGILFLMKDSHVYDPTFIGLKYIYNHDPKCYF